MRMARRQLGNGLDWIAYPPGDDLMRESVALTNRMRRLAIPTATSVPVKRPAGPGRLIARNAAQAAGLRARGNVAAAMAVPLYRGRQVTRSPQPPAVIGIMSDVSASMGWSTTAVGEAAWLLARGAAHSGARVASVVFGKSVEPIVFPGEIPQTVLVRAANQGSHDPARALAALDGALNLSEPTLRGVQRSRIVIIVSDLCWGIEREGFLLRARRLMASGVRFLAIGPRGETPPARGWDSGGQHVLQFLHAGETLAALGCHVVLPPDPGKRVSEWVRDGWTWCEEAPPPFAGDEVRIARLAGTTASRPDPMLVLPQDAVRVPAWSMPDEEAAASLRRNIVDGALAMLERVT